MAKKKESKKIKVRDMKPKKDAKGGFMMFGQTGKQQTGGHQQTGGGNKGTFVIGGG